MKCKETKTKLHFWINNQLHQKEIQELENHLSSCKTCSNYRNDLLLYQSLIGKLDNPAPCSLDPLNVDAESEKKRKKFWEFSGFVAAACLGILIGMSLFRFTNIKNATMETSIIAEDTTKEDTQNTINKIEKTYYQPMSFMVYYDDFFISEESFQPQACSYSSK